MCKLTAPLVLLLSLAACGGDLLSADEMLERTASAVAAIGIPRGTITDHADANISRSIAWYFAKYGATRTYRLTTRYRNSASTRYQLGSTLAVPKGATLTASTKVQLRATTKLENKTMISLDDGATISRLELHGGRQALHVVYSSKKRNVRIVDCTIHQTKNDYTNDNTSRRPHLVMLNQCTRCTVRRNLMRRAGCGPKANPKRWSGVAAAIYAPNNRDLVVANNDVALTLTAGIDFTGTVGADITSNVVSYTGQNDRYGFAIADGITAYHNRRGYTYLDYWVSKNVVRYYRNHGIHVSGRDVHVEDNRVYGGVHNAIRIGDWRSPPDCASNFTVKRNYVTSGSDRGWTKQALYFDNYKRGAAGISGNTGDVANVYWGRRLCR